jgi:hypothetical protein
VGDCDSRLLAVAGFTLSYRRYFLRIPERQEGPSHPSRAGWMQSKWLSRAQRLWLRPGMETACYGFLLKTVLRSEAHLVFLGLWSGIGLLIALENLGPVSSGHAPSASILSAGLTAPLTLAFAIIAGLRFVFDIPAAIEANWVFRMGADEHTNLWRSACQKATLTFIVPWLLFLWLPFAASRWGWADATLVAVMDLCLIVAGIDLTLSRFRKIPFTCSFAAGRDHLLKMILGCSMILLFLIPLLAGVEARILAHPARIVTFVLFIVAIVAFLRRSEAAAPAEPIFEDKGEPPFALLHLSGD